MATSGLNVMSEMYYVDYETSISLGLPELFENTAK